MAYVTNDPVFPSWYNPAATATNTSTNGTPYADLASSVNQFMTSQAQAPYIQNLPNYMQSVAQRSANTGQMLKGEVPTDVVNQIMQQAAERGIAGGAPSSQNSNAAYLRALGLNSLQMMQQGSQQFSQEIADTPVPELWNPMSLVVPQTLAAQEQAAAQQGMNQAWALQNRASRPQPRPIDWSRYHMWNGRLVANKSGSDIG